MVKNIKHFCISQFLILFAITFVYFVTIYIIPAISHYAELLFFKLLGFSYEHNNEIASDVPYFGSMLYKGLVYSAILVYFVVEEVEVLRALFSPNYSFEKYLQRRRGLDL